MKIITVLLFVVAISLVGLSTAKFTVSKTFSNSQCSGAPFGVLGSNNTGACPATVTCLFQQSTSMSVDCTDTAPMLSSLVSGSGKRYAQIISYNNAQGCADASKIQYFTYYQLDFCFSASGTSSTKAIATPSQIKVFTCSDAVCNTCTEINYPLAECASTGTVAFASVKVFSGAIAHSFVAIIVLAIAMFL